MPAFILTLFAYLVHVVLHFMPDAWWSPFEQFLRDAFGMQGGCAVYNFIWGTSFACVFLGGAIALLALYSKRANWWYGTAFALSLPGWAIFCILLYTDWCV